MALKFLNSSIAIHFSEKSVGLNYLHTYNRPNCTRMYEVSLYNKVKLCISVVVLPRNA
jgi:hypothetical protein